MSNRASYEARHTPRAAAVARTARGDCSQPGSDSAVQRRSRAIRLAARLVRETAPKGARMFTANDITPTCKAQSSQLAPSPAARHLQGGSRGAPISRTCSKRPPTAARSPKHGDLYGFSLCGTTKIIPKLSNALGGLSQLFFYAKTKLGYLRTKPGHRGLSQTFVGYWRAMPCSQHATSSAQFWK